jgi:phosphatidylinositol-3-phosphatase
MGNDPARDHTVATARGPACGHPATWAIDHTQNAEQGDQYAARHDGFTFFTSVTANQAFCAAHILSFWPLAGDLAQASTTLAFSFIAPDLCNDGHDSPCITGGPGGLAQAGAVLLSPLIRPGTVSTVDYNHYSLLRSIEDIFGLPHLGDAAMPQVRSFGPDIFG